MKEEDLAREPGQQAAWLRQDNLGYVGLLGTGLIWVQPFLSATSLDLPAKICVVAWAVALPLLAALVLLNEQEAFRRRRSGSVLANVGKAIAQCAALVGFVAGFWHIWWPAGATLIGATLVAATVHSAGYVHLEGLGRRSSRPDPPEAPAGPEAPAEGG